MAIDFLKSQKVISISVIIPMYNSAKTIAAVLDSVYSQTAFHLISEIIIIDDGSTDQSAQIVKEYMALQNDDLIQYHYQDNKGVSSARNHGMKLATGDYIAFLDSDDLWLPQKIQRQTQILLEKQNIAFLGCSSSEGSFRVGMKKYNHLFQVNIRMLCLKSFPTVPSVIFKTTAIEKIGYFDESMKYSEDMNYFHRFCTELNYWFLPEKLVEIGFNKKYDSQSGLSSNIRKMHLGRKKNMQILYRQKNIRFIFYCFISVYNELKFIIYYTLNKLSKIKVLNRLLIRLSPKV